MGILVNRKRVSTSGIGLCASQGDTIIDVSGSRINTRRLIESADGNFSFGARTGYNINPTPNTFIHPTGVVIINSSVYMIGNAPRLGNLTFYGSTAYPLTGDITVRISNNVGDYGDMTTVGNTILGIRNTSISKLTILANALTVSDTITLPRSGASVIASYNNKLLIYYIGTIGFYDYDYDPVNHTISNEQQITFTNKNIRGMTRIGNKLLIAHRDDDDTSNEVFIYDYIIPKIASFSDTISRNDILGTSVRHITKITDDISHSANVGISGVGKNLSDFLPHTDIISLTKLATRNIPNNVLATTDGVTKKYTTEKSLKDDITTQAILESLGQGMHSIRDNPNTTDILKVDEHAFRNFTDDIIPSDSVNKTRIEQASISADITTQDMILTDQEITKEFDDTISKSDIIQSQSGATVKLESDISYNDSLHLITTSERDIKDDISTSAKSGAAVTRLTEIRDALLGDPQSVFTNFDDGTSNRYGWIGGGISNRFATVSNNFRRTFTDFNPYRSVITIWARDPSSPNTYTIEVTANSKTVSLGPYISNLPQPVTIVLGDDFENERTDVEMRFKVPNAGAFFLSQIRYSENSQLYDRVDILSHVDIKENIIPTDILQFINSPIVELSDESDIIDHIIVSTSQELVEQIATDDIISLKKQTYRAIADAILPQDMMTKSRIETGTATDQIDVSDKVNVDEDVEILLLSEMDTTDKLERKQLATQEATDTLSISDNVEPKTFREILLKSATTILARVQSRVFVGQAFKELLDIDDKINLLKYATNELLSKISPNDIIQEYRTNTRNIKDIKDTTDNVDVDKFLLQKFIDSISTNDTVFISKHAMLGIRDQIVHNAKVTIIKLGSGELRSRIIISDRLNTDEIVSINFKNILPHNDILGIMKLATREILDTKTVHARVELIKLALTGVRSTIGNINAEFNITKIAVKNITSDIITHVILSTGTGRDALLTAIANTQDKVTNIKFAIKEVKSILTMKDTLFGPSIGITFDVNTIRRKVFRF